jgi:hypothetical protein
VTEETEVAFPELPPDPNCRSCSRLRTDIAQMRVENERNKAYAETAALRISELERDLASANAATVLGREAETVKKLQRIDVTQRRDLDACYDEISRLRQENERLSALLRSHKVDFSPTRVPASSPPMTQAAAAGWGALTGNQGVGND